MWKKIGKIFFLETNQGDIHLTVRINDKPTFEQLDYLIKIFFELSPLKSLSPKKLIKDYCEKQSDLQFYENQYCWKTNSHKFCRKVEKHEWIWKRCFTTYGDQTKLEEHKLSYIEQEVCSISFMPSKTKDNL